jgi:hypothetical protein
MKAQRTLFLPKGVAMTRTHAAPTTDRATATVRAVQAGAVLSVLALLWQFATAGRYLSGSTDLDLHAAGAIALHITTFLLLVATLLHARAGGARWPVVVAAAVFVATFVQAALGDAGNLSAHVPGALVLVAGVIWITAWAFGRRPAA